MPISLTLISRTLSRHAPGIWRDCCWLCRIADCSFCGLTRSNCNVFWAPYLSTYGLRAVLIKSRCPVGRLACDQARQTVTLTKAQNSEHESESNLEQSGHTLIFGEAQLPKLSQRHGLVFISLASWQWQRNSYHIPSLFVPYGYLAVLRVSTLKFVGLCSYF